MLFNALTIEVYKLFVNEQIFFCSVYKFLERGSTNNHKVIKSESPKTVL